MQKPTLRLLIQTGEVCKCLRAKTLFYEVDEQAVDPDSGYVLYSGMNGPFWCAVTQGLQGPDGKIASIEHCGSASGRGCCETA
jgi:hypothetical protein